MSRWIAKAVTQKAVSLLPAGRSVNYLLQKHVTKSLRFDITEFESRMEECRWHLESYFKYRRAEGPPSVLELGTGWFPFIAIGYYLCGAKHVWTVDKDPLLRADSIRKTIENYTDYLRGPKSAWMRPWLDPNRTKALQQLASGHKSGAEILGELGIEAIVADVCELKLPQSADIVCSNTVLSEIPQPILMRIFASFRRLASPPAIMTHHISMWDYWAKFDHSISRYNFLRFSDFQWRLISNSLVHNNRLRICDYRRLHASNSFTILEEQSEPGSLKEIRSVRLSPRFQEYSLEDLLPSRTWMVSTLNSQ